MLRRVWWPIWGCFWIYIILILIWFFYSLCCRLTAPDLSWTLFVVFMNWKAEQKQGCPVCILKLTVEKMWRNWGDMRIIWCLLGLTRQAKSGKNRCWMNERPEKNWQFWLYPGLKIFRGRDFIPFRSLSKFIHGSVTEMKIWLKWRLCCHSFQNHLH